MPLSSEHHSRVKFILSPEGRILDSAILECSESPDFDQSCLDALLNVPQLTKGYLVPLSIVARFDNSKYVRYARGMAGGIPVPGGTTGFNNSCPVSGGVPMTHPSNGSRLVPPQFVGPASTNFGIPTSNSIYRAPNLAPSGAWPTAPNTSPSSSSFGMPVSSPVAPPLPFLGPLPASPYSFPALPFSNSSRVPPLMPFYSRRLASRSAEKHSIQKNLAGRFIELDDGSIYEVETLDRITTSLWLPYSDVLVIDDIEMIYEDDDEIVHVTRVR